MDILTPKGLKELREACSAIANSNWDSAVTVEQDETGFLTFKLWNEDEDLVAHWTAIFAGEVDGRQIFSFKNVLDVSHTGAVCSLTPAAICGLMEL